MTAVEALGQGRDAFARQAWTDAYRHLSVADQDRPLGGQDLESLAVCAYMLGKDDDSVGIWARAYHAVVDRDVKRAARCAFWLAFVLLNLGDLAVANGWLARAGRLLSGAAHACPEQGYLLLPSAIRAIAEGDHETALKILTEAGEIGFRFDDQDLVALAGQLQGRVLIRLGRGTEGMTVLDELMVAVTTGEVSSVVAGHAYCSVLEACQETYDVRRAQEWTAAFTRWCCALPDSPRFTGMCLVHQSEVKQLLGRWPDALAAARHAIERFTAMQRFLEPAAGAACYQLAGLHRVRGEYALAEQAYQQANCWGHRPQPGLALLRLAQGEVGMAISSIRWAIEETHSQVPPPDLLAAGVEIMLAAGDVKAARLAAGKLLDIAADTGAPVLAAVAAHAHGAVLLAAGDPRGSCAASSKAFSVWQELNAPYEAARSHVLLGLACRELGDEDTATLELTAARRVFQHLGAVPEMAKLDSVARPRAAPCSSGLTTRETEVLKLVAAGKTNRAIAGDLFLSEKTVARHVSNILTKLGVQSRVAATAYAYEHSLV